MPHVKTFYHFALSLSVVYTLLIFIVLNLRRHLPLLVHRHGMIGKMLADVDSSGASRTADTNTGAHTSE